jgi:hypothetical protein
LFLAFARQSISDLKTMESQIEELRGLLRGQDRAADRATPSPTLRGEVRQPRPSSARGFDAVGYAVNQLLQMANTVAVVRASAFSSAATAAVAAA